MIDFEELERELKAMNNTSKLFKLIKKELESRGHWRALRRGKEFKRGKDERRKAL